MPPDRLSLDRRSFIKLGASSLIGVWAAGSLQAYAQTDFVPARSPDVDLELPGVTKPFSFVHLTDAHLCECDSRDQGLSEYMSARSKGFGSNLLKRTRDVFEASNALQPDFIAFTGDLVDVPTSANLDALSAIFSSSPVPCWMTMGNHEWEKPAIPASSVFWQRRLQGLAGQPLDWHVRELNGVNLLFVDNSDYQFTKDQLARTIPILNSGRPCLLFIHIPLSLDSLLPAVDRAWKIRIVVGGKDPVVSPTDATREFGALVKSHPAVAAIFAGHIHFEHQDRYRDDSMQHVGRPVFASGLRRISVKPRREAVAS